ncbi:hypothetical protein DDE82_007906 [Stemphylium lycopersici]|uniref:Uncharacterized protein n=1 Tax=Stemphylium lycopersici TaxID=183478 RepID=A0A364NFH4_STELY|nr:hypothetical protein TW65_04165 [Stemphylium lycopersici]RAQ99777.1 hypothetical protein DDE82_007906 [Stemphylium lycopersici]RAR15861.1 hypothetical protein DDE83_000658 [Stemphylium lycopersici]
MEMQRVDCGCAFLALRTLARVEELTTSSQVPLETALQVTSAAERPSLAVLSCERCRQQRLPLTAITILCAHLVDWLCRLWNLDCEDVTETSTDTNGTTTPPTATTTTTNATSANESQHMTPPAAQSWKFSLGSYDLAADEADALSNELMTLRLTGFSAVLGSLEAALVTSGPSPPVSSSPNGGSSGTTSEAAPFSPACLEIVRTNLRLVRACIRRLKARSLLNSGGASNVF